MKVQRETAWGMLNLLKATRRLTESRMAHEKRALSMLGMKNHMTPSGHTYQRHGTEWSFGALTTFFRRRRVLELADNDNFDALGRCTNSQKGLGQYLPASCGGSATGTDQRLNLDRRQTAEWHRDEAGLQESALSLWGMKGTSQFCRIRFGVSVHHAELTSGEAIRYQLPERSVRSINRGEQVASPAPHYWTVGFVSHAWTYADRGHLLDWDSARIGT